MSRPRFLADHDLNEHTIDGVLRRMPAVQFIRAREVGLEGRPNADVLDYAVAHAFVVISHDVNTMPAAALTRLSAGQSFPGLFKVRQQRPIAPIIDSLLLIWSASQAEEWRDQIWFLPI